ncbi:hypothetical protein FDO65_19310 [Nakamurella flava]|uniref:Hemerythrin-like domain-containing protein n=1 Tax=Nakamurella flava TaxID=2576308 RepID=A0A4U6QAJ8_9ACTN|nr:hemerythrin domain-containing protein [Nakamurella flava]TKV56973.1 hypothetical protein FDO65_19310 [Nakamurella flava]
MSALDPRPLVGDGPAVTLTERPTARPTDLRATLDEAVHHAVRRDLQRLVQVLSDPVTTVRRAAIVGHIEFLVPRLLAHHAGEDRRWNRLCDRRPDLAGHAAAARSGHRAVRRAGQDVLSAARTWAADGDRDARTTLRRRVSDLAALAAEQFEHDERDRALLHEPTLALDRPRRTTTGPGRSPRRTGRRPASVAHETFWLVDELDPALAARIVGRHSRTARWAMRNLFSGGYNRSTHLMWVGGGDGPAI